MRLSTCVTKPPPSFGRLGRFNRKLGGWPLWLFALLALPLIGCNPSPLSGGPADADSAQAGAKEEVELAPIMGQMQRHSAKLGYAIHGHNHPLATFYLEELAETLDLVRAVPMHDGMPIGHPAQVILIPALETLATALEGESWPDTWSAYKATIDACNRCHVATEHAFIEILPADGPAPYNQRFAAADPADE